MKTMKSLSEIRPVQILCTAALLGLSMVPAGAQSVVGKVEGKPSVHRESVAGHRYGARVGSIHILVPSTYAGVSSFRVRMPWGGHIIVPGVHVRSPRVGVSSPRVAVSAPVGPRKRAE
jgi:hypothetical protein